MSKIQYKDVPIYIAHADGSKTDTSVVNTIIDKSIAEGSIKSVVIEGYKAADESVKNWADSKFQTK